MKNFELDFTSATIPFNHYWELCVGSCHAVTALREDYRRQLEQCRRESGFCYIRFHGLFDDDMSVLLQGNALMVREAEALPLSFTNSDSIFDYLLSIRMKPFIELGFMPAALTSNLSGRTLRSRIRRAARTHPFKLIHRVTLFQ